MSGALSLGVIGGADGSTAVFVTGSPAPLVIYLRDPLKPKPHEPEVNSIFRICDEHNIPLATNLATAELLILSLDRGDLDWREMYK